MLAARVTATKEARFFRMSYFAPKPRRTAALSVRVPPAVKVGVEKLAKLWTRLEQIQAGDPQIEVTPADVINRLLEVGLEGAWAEVGGEPRTDAELETLLKRSEKLLLDTKK